MFLRLFLYRLKIVFLLKDADLLDIGFSTYLRHILLPGLWQASKRHGAGIKHNSCRCRDGS